MREEEGTGHSTWIIIPANRVGGQVPSGDSMRNLGRDHARTGASCKWKGRWVMKDKEVIIYEYLLCSRHMIKSFIQMLSS